MELAKEKGDRSSENKIPAEKCGITNVNGH
jgi:hypothetical protein